MQWRLAAVVIASALAGILIVGSAASTSAPPYVYVLSFSASIREDARERETVVTGDCTYDSIADWHNRVALSSRSTRITVTAGPGQRPRFLPAEIRNVDGTVRSNGLFGSAPPPGCNLPPTSRHCGYGRARPVTNQAAALVVRSARNLGLGRLRPQWRGCGSTAWFGEPPTDLNLAGGNGRLAVLARGIPRLTIRGSYAKSTVIGSQGGSREGTLDARVEWTLTFRRRR